MLKKVIVKMIVLTAVLSVSTLSYAVSMPPVPTAPIYFEPPVVEPTAELETQSCAQIDNAIRYLHPYRYTYKPGFYDDGFNKVAVAASTTQVVDKLLSGLLGVAYLGYSALVEEKEERRMLGIEQQIAMLQRLKAEKHCFE